MSALNFLSTDTRLVEQAKTIIERLHSHGYQAYFAGGCVRDALRQAPVKEELSLRLQFRRVVEYRLLLIK
jgi:hypothetical protein